MASIDARKALDIIIDKLLNNDGYYIWTALGDPCVWLIRIPREDKGDDDWDKKEDADMIHICRPSNFVEAMESNNRKDLSVFTGYVIDSKCVRCSRPIPEDVERKLGLQVKLTKLRKKAL